MRRALAVLLVSSLGAGTALAADASLPNEPLHGVKLATEEMRLGFAQAPDQRVAVLLDIAEARLTEAKELQAGQRDAEADAAVSAYAERVAAAAVHVEEQSVDVPAAAERFRSEVRKQQAGIPSGGPAETSSVAIALELRPTLARDRQAAPHEIAAAAATVADKAATSVEQRVGPAATIVQPPVVTSPTQIEQTVVTPVEQTVAPSVTRVEQTTVPSATPVEQTAVPSAAAQMPRSTSDVVSAPSASSASPVASPPSATTPALGAPARAAATAQPDAAPTPSAEEAKKTGAAAKAARESAERAKHAADQAKQSAAKNAREKAK